MIDAATTKPFGFMPVHPGPGWAGIACRSIRRTWRGRSTGSLGDVRFVEIANDVNDRMPDYVVSRVVERLNRRRRAVNGSRVLLVGLTYKRNSGDARQSPAAVVAHRLAALGAELHAVDPLVAPSDDRRACSLSSAYRRSSMTRTS